MYICKEVFEKHTPAVKAIHEKVGQTVEMFLTTHKETFTKLVRDQMLMNQLGEVDNLPLGESTLHLKMVESNIYTRARTFIANNTAGVSLNMLLHSLEAVESQQLELPTHLQGHLDEHGARSWHWIADLELHELSGTPMQLFVDTTAAIIALSSLAKENKSWLECSLTFPETDEADVLPITPSTVSGASTFDRASSKAYIEAARKFCENAYKMPDLVNMQLIEFSEKDVELNKAGWLARCKAKEEAEKKETKLEAV